MKFALAAILSIIVFLASFGSSLAILDYQLYRDFYEAKCVNKAAPEMHCHGKCALRKQEKSTGRPSLMKICCDFNFVPTFLENKIIFRNIFLRQTKIAVSGNFALLKGFARTISPPPSV